MPKPKYCAKCGKEIDTEDYGSYGSMGDISYGESKAPFLCKPKCHDAWAKHIRNYLMPINRKWYLDWVLHFEAWIGYVWKGTSLMALEKVVFT